VLLGHAGALLGLHALPGPLVLALVLVVLLALTVLVLVLSHDRAFLVGDCWPMGADIRFARGYKARISGS
jgi:hypothetical protein